jgi:hypothetical protein
VGRGRPDHAVDRDRRGDPRVSPSHRILEAGDLLQITRTSTQRLVPGVSFVLHACLLDEPAAAGVVVGGTFTIREDGVEMLAGAGPVDLVAV